MGVGSEFLVKLQLMFKQEDMIISYAHISGPVMLPIGAQMAQLGQLGLPIPEFVKDDDSDSPRVKSVKKLIRRMIKYEPKQRCYMRQVVAVLEDLGGMC